MQNQMQIDAIEARAAATRWEQGLREIYGIREDEDIIVECSTLDRLIDNAINLERLAA